MRKEIVETTVIRIPKALVPDVKALRDEWQHRRKIEEARKLLEEVGEVA